MKGYLLDRKRIWIGDRVRARFHTVKNGTHTCLDIACELILGIDDGSRVFV